MDGSINRQGLPRLHGHGRKVKIPPNGQLLDRGSSKRHQSVPVNPADRPNPEEKPLPWRDIGDLDTNFDFLYPDNPIEECPVQKVEHLETEQQQPYMRWIERIFNIDRRTILDCTVHTVT